MQECEFELNGKPMSSFRIGAIEFPAFSGFGEHLNRPHSACISGIGPIPPGGYYIFDRESGGLLGTIRDVLQDRSDWFALHAIDRKIDDEMFCNAVKRGAFRLHPKGSLGISRGCITLERLIDFRFIRSVLKSSPPIAVPGSTLKAYGKVIVR